MDAAFVKMSAADRMAAIKQACAIIEKCGDQYPAVVAILSAFLQSMIAPPAFSDSPGALPPATSTPTWASPNAAANTGVYVGAGIDDAPAATFAEGPEITPYVTDNVLIYPIGNDKHFRSRNFRRFYEKNVTAEPGDGLFLLTHENSVKIFRMHPNSNNPRYDTDTWAALTEAARDLAEHDIPWISVDRTKIKDKSITMKFDMHPVLVVVLPEYEDDDKNYIQFILGEMPNFIRDSRDAQ